MISALSVFGGLTRANGFIDVILRSSSSHFWKMAATASMTLTAV